MNKRIPLSRIMVVIAVMVVLFLPGSSQAVAQDTPPVQDIAPLVIYVVQPGDNLRDIAARFRSSVSSIQETNHLGSPQDITVGQNLIIPTANSRLADWANPVSAGLEDNLFTLSKRYGIPVEELGLSLKVTNPYSLYAGQPIPIPGQDNTSSYTLTRFQEGDTLWKIALQSNSNIYELMLLNQIAHPTMVAPGELLLISGQNDYQGTILPVPWKQIAFHPLQVEPGRSGGLRVETTIPGTLQATFIEPLQIVSVDGLYHEAVFGISRYTQPGFYTLSLNFQSADGRTWIFDKAIQVLDGGYSRESIRIPEEKAAVLNDPATVQSELTYLSNQMSTFTPERYWDGLFLRPSPGVLTSGFGTLRSYNGSGFDTFHSGNDFGAKTGTPILAPGDGYVVDTGELEVRGLVTLINHGNGVYTGYWHQSSILVNPGDYVYRGQQIGTVGNTGLSDASHLHWEMWINGIQIDALQWVREEFP